MYSLFPKTPITQEKIDELTVETLFRHDYMRTSEYDSWVCSESCLEEYELKLEKEVLAERDNL